MEGVENIFQVKFINMLVKTKYIYMYLYLLQTTMGSGMSENLIVKRRTTHSKISISVGYVRAASLQVCEFATCKLPRSHHF